MKENINNIIYKLLLFTSTIFLVFSVVDLAGKENNIFKVDQIIISGCNLIKEESLEKQFSYLINKNIYSLNSDDIENKILENEFISSVNLIKVYPRTIILDVIEISPIGIFKSNNTNFLVDNNNNGFLCSSSVSSSINVPELQSDGELNIKNIFDSNEYKILHHAFNNVPAFFNVIKTIKSSNDNIIVNTMNSWISFDKNHYMEQANYISDFLNNMNSYEYIKFSHLDVIVKNRNRI